MTVKPRQRTPKLSVRKRTPKASVRRIGFPCQTVVLVPNLLRESLRVAPRLISGSQTSTPTSGEAVLRPVLTAIPDQSARA
eukprot:3455945-Pleurochrysis_carterae.AAC.1